MRYVQLTLLLRKCSQKQMQIVAGGLVYIMFRRPLLGTLNAIWEYCWRAAGAGPVEGMWGNTGHALQWHQSLASILALQCRFQLWQAIERARLFWRD